MLIQVDECHQQEPEAHFKTEDKWHMHLHKCHDPQADPPVDETVDATLYFAFIIVHSVVQLDLESSRGAV